MRDPRRTPEATHHLAEEIPLQESQPAPGGYRGEPDNVADLEPLLTARQVAGILNMSPNTVLDRYEAGELPGFKLWRGVDSVGRHTGPVRFRPSAIAEWIEQQGTAA
jgi:hypothetical protein